MGSSPSRPLITARLMTYTKATMQPLPSPSACGSLVTARKDPSGMGSVGEVRSIVRLAVHHLCVSDGADRQNCSPPYEVSRTVVLSHARRASLSVAIHELLWRVAA